MDSVRFDRITKLFADRKISRRAAVVHGGTGLAAGALAAAGLPSVIHAQDAPATPESDAAPTVEGKTAYLFVQSFQSGSITPTEGEDGRYTMTLEHGLGQTIYFADRPSRDVGAAPTPQFMDGLGFPEDNPPNAALVVETALGETDVAVVELFNPSYDEATHTATYDIEVLANWENSLDLGFHEAPTDLATVEPTFGAAHLFIDDCSDRDIWCRRQDRGDYQSLGMRGMCWMKTGYWCNECEDYSVECNARFPEFCAGQCYSDPHCYNCL